MFLSNRPIEAQLNQNIITTNNESAHERYLEIISQLAIDLISLHSLEDVLWHVARKVIAELGFNDVVIYLYNPETKTLAQRAAYGNKSPESYVLLNPIELHLGEGIVGQVAQQKQPKIINDTRLEPSYVADDEIRLSEISVPMIAQGRLIGVIDSENEQLGYYNETHLKLLTSIASITATKVYAVQAHERLQSSLEKLEYNSKIQDVLFEIAELIFTTDSLKEFYYHLHLSLGKLTFTKNFFIALEQNGGKEVCFPFYVDEKDSMPDQATFTIDRKNLSITTYLLINNRPMLFTKDDISQLMADGIITIRGTIPKSWLGIPFQGEKIKGAVVVQSYDDRFVFKKQDKQLLSFVAKHIHNAIDRMQTKAQLQFLALHDSLTKLPNRTLFSDRLSHALAFNKRYANNALAVFFLDLDNFKPINDTYGHRVGDILLKKVSKRIGSGIREIDTLARLGGDEFAILIENAGTFSEVKEVAQKIIELAQTPFKIGQFNIATSTSIGMVYYQGCNKSTSEILVEADEAMYRAKALGRNQVYVFEKDVHFDINNTKSLDNEFNLAVNNGDLQLYFQPLIDLQSKTIIAAETLIRWFHPSVGLVMPDKFIEQLEKNGLIANLDVYVLKASLAFIQRQSLPKGFKLNINLSSAGFVSKHLMDILKKTEPELLVHLCFEITEQSIVKNIKQTQKSMAAYKKMGIDIALDDFGTGYSSLSYLHMFKFDMLKIDRSFISVYDKDERNVVILESIINLASSLGIETTAEGIETESQLQLMQTMGCDKGQGYFISKPMPELDFVTFINK